jgi:4-amino-4-deoxy-L-arabinose transferase-like glycosyltransferase
VSASPEHARAAPADLTGAGAPASIGWAIVPILAVAGFVLVRSLDNVPYYPESDDGYYLRYMKAVAESGPAAFPRLFAEYLGRPENFNFPPPSRIGFTILTALWAKLSGASLESLSRLSVAAHLATVLAAWHFARKSFGTLGAVLISASLAFSPLLLGMGREALMDSVVLFVFSLAIWLFLEVVRRPDNRRAQAAFALAFLLAVLTKELALFLVLPFLAFVAWERIAGRRTPSPLVVLGLIAVPGIAALLLLVLAAGGIAPLAAVFRGILAGPATNPYTVQLGSGPWYRYLIDYLLLSPWPTVCALCYAGVLVTRARRREAESAQVYFLLLAALLLLEHAFVTKNVRYLMVLELPLRIFAVAMLGELFAARDRRKTAALVALLVLAFAALDVATFDHVFVANRAYDPVSYPLLVLRKVVPWSR